MELVDKNIINNRKKIELAFNYPLNRDIVIRNFTSAGVDCFIAYIDGMAGSSIISDFILRPLLNRKSPSEPIFHLLQISVVKSEVDMQTAISAILQGDCALFCNDEPYVYICETKRFEKRGVDRPQVENSIIGSQEAFNESFRTNTTLLHKIIKNPGLTTEVVTVGKLGNLTCGIVYLNGVVNNDLREEVRRRLEGIDSDFVQSGGMLAQFIEDRANTFFQTVNTTERPDNAAALIMQGRIAIIADGSPRVIITPASLSSILKTSEESALRTPLASTVRWIRILAVLAALFAPALYLAITTFHPQMIPASLLLSIAEARINIPFPALFELLVMEISFELIREAGERIPGPLGSTIGIVGGLILGEAAVSAGLVSQACVVVIAFSALGNFAIPQYQAAFTARLLRVGFIISAGLFGFLGIAAASVLMVGYMNSLTSLGTDFIPCVFSGEAPMFPKRPVWKYERRPSELNTERPESQPSISMKWKENRHE